MLEHSLFSQNKMISMFLLLLASVFIFVIAQFINQLLISYELSSMYISFCAGFILFTPLVSLTLHPLLFSQIDDKDKLKKSALVVNIGLVMLVQGLFFLIWITDAIAIYSIYVDSNSFLANAFNISSETSGNLGSEFYIANIFLAWLFALLSLTIGLLPCLIARLKNLGVVGNFVAAFGFFKVNKIKLSVYAVALSGSVILTLLYVNVLFLLLFPITLAWVFIAIAKDYLSGFESYAH